MKFTIWQNLVVILTLFMNTVAQALTTDVSCLFETTEQLISEAENHNHHGHKPKSSKWYFWRTDKEVEVSNGGRNFGEKWIKTDKQKIFYQVLYHDKMFLLGFQPADLQILGKKTNWEMRSTLFPQSLLEKLERKKTIKFKNYDTVRYQGKIAGVDYQVDWVPELRLPSKVKITSSNNMIFTELKEVYPLEKTPYKQLETENYDDMDYADIGDNESHPIVSQLQNNSGIGYFHQH